MTSKNKWKKILVPSGRDYEHCVGVFEEKFGITVPRFSERQLSVESNGRLFAKVKSRDMPELLRIGFGDIGIIYTDICQEKLSALPSLAYDIIGSPKLQFCLLIPKETYDQFIERLYNIDFEPLSVATTYPAFLKLCLEKIADEGGRLNVVISPFTPSGSMEAMPSLGVSDVVADAVNTGTSADANHLIPLRLADISPALIYRKS